LIALTHVRFIANTHMTQGSTRTCAYVVTGAESNAGDGLVDSILHLNVCNPFAFAEH
jgi:hypothetical protein